MSDSKLQNAREYAEKMIAQHLDPTWTFAWNNRKRAFGLCSYTKREIQLSRVLCAVEKPEAMRQTVLHEIAHALAGHEAGHGPRWRAVAQRIGVKNPSAVRNLSNGESTRPAYKYAIMFGDTIVKGYYNKPSAAVHRKLPHMYLRGRPSTRGQLRIVQM